jgi:hypothetical protein
MLINIFSVCVCFLIMKLCLCLALKRTDQVDVIRDLIVEKLPTQNYNVLKYLIEFLNLVRREKQNVFSFFFINSKCSLGR